MSSRGESNDDNIDKEEKEANLAVTNLINNINTLTLRNDPLIKCIKSPKLLIRGLTELRLMVEMMDIKHAIVNQIKFLITNQARKTSLPNVNNKSGFEGHMLHSVISGNPGTGKTTVGMILAKIWMSLGFIKPPQQQSNAPIVINNTTLELYRKKILELEEFHKHDTNKIQSLKTLISKYHNVFTDLRLKTIRLKSSYEKLSSIPSLLDDWDMVISSFRKLRSGFDEILREAHSNINPSQSPSNPAESDPYENTEPKFVVAAREDLVAEFLGQTAPKTKKVLESARGGVLFIDEAYSICNMDGGSKDKYGEECLTTINEFMSLHPDEIIIIFAGYRDLLMSSIFKAQPGLYRRIAHFFEIKDYTNKGLSKIFMKQLAKDSWILDSNIDLKKLLDENKDIISYGGGFTEKLAFFTKLMYAKTKFDETINKTTSDESIHNSIITYEMICGAIKMMKVSFTNDKTFDLPPEHMYI